MKQMPCGRRFKGLVWQDRRAHPICLLLPSPLGSRACSSKPVQCPFFRLLLGVAVACCKESCFLQGVSYSQITPCLDKPPAGQWPWELSYAS